MKIQSNLTGIGTILTKSKHPNVGAIFCSSIAKKKARYSQDMPYKTTLAGSDTIFRKKSMCPNLESIFHANISKIWIRYRQAIANTINIDSMLFCY